MDSHVALSPVEWPDDNGSLRLEVLAVGTDFRAADLKGRNELEADMDYYSDWDPLVEPCSQLFHDHYIAYGQPSEWAIYQGVHVLLSELDP